LKIYKTPNYVNNSTKNTKRQLNKKLLVLLSNTKAPPQARKGSSKKIP